MMHPHRQCFELLKEEVSAVYRAKNAEAPGRMEDWSGKVLEGFRQDLLGKVKSSISTKWFYTHIKGPYSEKLPRIDVLNLLCAYAGYKSWDEFLTEKKEIEPLTAQVEEREEEVKQETEPPANEKTIVERNGPLKPGTGNVRGSKSIQMFLAMSLLLLIAFASLMFIYRKNNTYHFCFVDADLGTPVKDQKVEVTLLRDKESPLLLHCDSAGCLSFEHDPGKVNFIVHAEYYLPDTITRTLGAVTEEYIPLKADDYALMIHIFSGSKMEDYEKRRKQLDNMFTDDAQVFQVNPGDGRGMEMYNKEEFINKLTMPISSLKDIEVIQTAYKGNKISYLRFIQKNE
jgi:hypothetical protein